MAIAELVLIRHGESTANVAREAAESEGTDTIAVEARDADVPLSPLGRRQAAALGQWLSQSAERRPARVWASPYARAVQTARIAMAEAGADCPLVLDERLRDKELGVLDTLTAEGVRRRFPDEDQRRRWLGKFYYRPPGGESWADMALRIRSFLADADRAAADERVMIVSHDAVVMLFCYVCLGLDEAQLLDLARSTSLVNTSITRLVRAAPDEPWALSDLNLHEHLVTADGEDLRTTHPADTVVAPQ